MKEKKDGKQAIFVVSFGTSYVDSKEATIGAIEKAIEKECKDFEIRRAFTSQIIIDILKDRDGEEIDNVKEALDKAVRDQVKKLVIQPTHLMDGYEYTDLINEVKKYEDKFDEISVGEPLLTSDEDFEKVIAAITKRTKDVDNGSTAICFMGHGTEADSNSVYSKMQEMITKAGHKNYYIGTVEATPTVEDVLALVKKHEDYKKVLLQPLMVVAGDHANNDMAGDEEDSWKSIFQEAGYEVECLLEGLGQNQEIQKIYVEHTKAAIEKLK